MHDLEKLIADWRRSLAQTSKHRPEALDELEAHLREEIEGRMRSGSSVEAAFTDAVAKLGPPASLGAEFAKLEAMRRSKWVPATLAQWGCIAIAVLSSVLLVARMGQGGMTPLLASHVLAVTVGYSMMFIMGGLAICYVLVEWSRRSRPSQKYALRRTMFQFATISATLTAIGVVLGMIWAKENWGRYWAWDPKETGGVVVLVCALVIAALRLFKSASYNILIVLGIVGNIGTAWGWFGTNANYNFGPLLTAFIAGHCLLLAAFFVTSRGRTQESPN